MEEGKELLSSNDKVSWPLPKYYANVCSEMSSDYSDYKNLIVPYGYSLR